MTSRTLLLTYAPLVVLERASQAALAVELRLALLLDPPRVAVVDPGWLQGAVQRGGWPARTRHKGLRWPARLDVSSKCADHEKKIDFVDR